MSEDLFGAPHSIPCLSLWQPWASLMAAGFKLHETRHWATPTRGRFAIRAAKRVDVSGAPHELCEVALGPDWAKTVPRGDVVGVGQLTACIRTEDAFVQVEECDLLAGNYAPERFAWRVDDFRPLRDPLPLIGRQSLFSWVPPRDLESRLLSPVNHQAQALRWLAHLA